MSIKNFLFLFLVIATQSGCEKDEIVQNDNINEEELSAPLFKESISGFVQKGPFINGSTIQISELEKNLVATGRNFTTQISNNSGSFSIKDVELKSQYASLKADGFYFNEVSGMTSTAPITLFAITDLKEKDKVNVNVLSYLEKARTEYLIGEGIGFAEAKDRAQKEVLAIFEIEIEGINNSENLDISQGGEENAILLAVSVILQGNRTEAQLSELMANIITDMKEDGTVDKAENGSALLNGIKNVSLAMVRKNVEERYKSLGISTSIGNFEKYVEDFKSKTDFVHVSEFSYPETGTNGLNILHESVEILDTKILHSFSFAVSIPDNNDFRALIKEIDGNLSFYNYENSAWEVHGSKEEGTIEIKSTKAGELIDINMDIFGTGSCLLEVYEGNSMEPTFTKRLRWEPKFILSYPTEGAFGSNLLNPSEPFGEPMDVAPGEYSLAITLPDDKEYQVEIRIALEQFGYITIDPAKVQNWQYEKTDHELILRLTGRGITADMPIPLYSNGSLHIQNNTDEIFYSVNCWNQDPPSTENLNFPTEGQNGLNLLGISGSEGRVAAGEYSMAINIPDDKDYFVEIRIHSENQESIVIDPAKVQNWQYNHNDHELVLYYAGRGTSLDMSVLLNGIGRMDIMMNARKTILWE